MQQKSSIKTYHIHIQGIVQGVGFRPFVYKLAKKQGLKGWVNNTNDGVHIHINTTETVAKKFLAELLNNLPPLAIVTKSGLGKVKFTSYQKFTIASSNNQEKPNLLLTPDVAICKNCKHELETKKNRRYHYPSITCTNCGPRYSIITKLPYDRPNTTMQKFKMCKTCLTEYNNPLERRHFSQTNSCPTCSIEMQLYQSKKLTPNFTDLDYIVSQWKYGKIIALKGIGGYLLTCDATNENAINELRKRKYRPHKPFALMYPNLEQIKKDTLLRNCEKKELESIHAPIVLLEIKKQMASKIALKSIVKDLSKIGIMLPYTPLYEILLSKFKRPIVATSGNISHSTIVFEDQVAIKELAKIADIILMNNRKITSPQDDSLVMFTKIHKQKIILRRSRGLAPIYINPKLELTKNTILATGAMLKSTFGIINNKKITLSQYLGNTENYDSQTNYQSTLKKIKTTLKLDIQAIVTDKHPAYFSTQFGKEKGQKKNINTIEVQHHKAHFYSVLGENNLLNSDKKILGVIWDGTGLGDDGNIWGGEFFIFKNKKAERVAHLCQFKFILANKMAKEPRISALAITHNMPEATPFLKPKFTPIEWKIYHKLLANSKLKSTSIGRLFDAISSLLFQNDIHKFEGEAAMKLEQKASLYIAENRINLTDSYTFNKSTEQLTKHLFTGIFKDLKKKLNKNFIAAKFHITLVDFIIKTAQKINSKHIAFSGGVFQNALLVDLIIENLQQQYTLYFHKEIPPNDEGIALGQLLYCSEIIKNKQ